MIKLRVLVACEYSGRVRQAFRDLGHDAWSCDLLPAEDGSEYHIQDDCLKVAEMGWDLMICHPPCTYLASSGLHWNNKIEGRQALTDAAVVFVQRLMAAPVKHIALENPIGCLSTKFRKPDQIIQPYQFNEDASKATCLWLKELPKLQPTLHYPGRLVDGRIRWGNQTDSGQNKLGPSEDRWKDRSRTYEGIARAMAQQWGQYVQSCCEAQQAQG